MAITSTQLFESFNRVIITAYEPLLDKVIQKIEGSQGNKGGKKKKLPPPGIVSIIGGFGNFYLMQHYIHRYLERNSSFAMDMYSGAYSAVNYNYHSTDRENNLVETLGNAYAGEVSEHGDQWRSYAVSLGAGLVAADYVKYRDYANISIGFTIRNIEQKKDEIKWAFEIGDLVNYGVKEYMRNTEDGEIQSFFGKPDKMAMELEKDKPLVRQPDTAHDEFFHFERDNYYEFGYKLDEDMGVTLYLQPEGEPERSMKFERGYFIFSKSGAPVPADKPLKKREQQKKPDTEADQEAEKPPEETGPETPTAQQTGGEPA